MNSRPARSLRISIPAVGRILRASEALGINTQLPALMNDWLQEADRAGFADEELAALIKILRGSRPVAEASLLESART